MKPVHERNQECLPPKKRDLPQNSTVNEDVARAVASSGTDLPVGADIGNWTRAVTIAAQTQPALRYGVVSENAEGIAGVTVDQYGMLYKVALPPGSYAPSALHQVVNVSHLPPAYNMPSQLLQHAGIPYPPIHYTQIPHASLQFVGSQYAVPYAVPPGFLPNPLVSPPASIPTSHVPHLVPYPSIIPEAATPPPQTPPPSHTFAKVHTASLPTMTPSGQLQHPSAGLHIDVPQGGVPVYFHPSRLTPAYAALAPAATVSGHDLSSEGRHVLPQVANGGEEEMDRGSGRGLHEMLDSHAIDSKREMHAPASTVESVAGSHHVSVHRLSMAESVPPVHRNTPDTDLEVQQVVGGGLVSQDYHSAAAHQKKAFSPLNLSQNAHKAQDCHPARDPSSLSIPKGPAESPAVESRTLFAASQHQDELGSEPPGQIHKTVVLANGQSVVITATTDHRLVNSVVAVAPEMTVAKALDLQVRGLPLDKVQPSRVQQTTSHYLPSHFMKGAIIQLASGELKRVEDLQTQDFVQSAEISGGLKIDSSTVVDIQESQRLGFINLHFLVGEQQSRVNIDVPPEHPFFVYGQGWSSCNPERTAQLFGLASHRLQVGDVCISLRLHATGGNAASQVMGPPASPATMHKSRAEATPPLPVEHTLQSERNSERPSQPERDMALRNSHMDHPGTGATPQSYQRRLSTPSFQRYSFQSEEPQLPTLRPSFIPQEVKLSIEGRSNAGK
uniref:Ataxin 1 like n=1 Tax=Latimeria chalumnae TaxID=7897 RepID=H3A2M3_LATCH